MACCVFQLDESGRKRVSAESYLAFAFIAALVTLGWPILIGWLGGSDLIEYLSALWNANPAQTDSGSGAADMRVGQDSFAALRVIGPLFLLAVLTALYRKILGITEE
jgi:hypothetical protein